ncbi:MAG: glutamate--tRNA ligase [Candidatus Moranbacteria bacterium]|nr:glutamate--tRNA ligase [Candidatus Moranbacteria bacterium]
MDKKVRVRFAPSPTGYLHIGGLKTALFDYLIAKKFGGDFILRIEDTDQKRHVTGAVEAVIKALEWAGLNYNEGAYLEKRGSTSLDQSDQKRLSLSESKTYPGIVEIGDYGPYIQSERLELYKKYAEQLVKDGQAYYCFCEPERLEKLRTEQAENKQAPMYDRYCLRNTTPEEVNKNLKNNCPYTIRLKIPEGQTKFKDLVYGEIEVDNATLDDQIILKSDGFPTYHLAVVVDDYLMKISHVIRGSEWLPSTPKHIILYQALGWKKDIPEFIHMPNMLNKDKKKLSKRRDSVSVEEFRQLGYPKEAILNYILLLGWNPKTEQEIFTLDEMVEQFDISKMNRSGGVFDIERLNWVSAQHIKKMSVDELYDRSLEFLQDKDFYKNAAEDKKSADYIKKILIVEQDRLAKFTEVGESNQFFFKDINYNKGLLRWKNSDDVATKENLEKSQNILNDISEADWTKENLEKNLLEAAGDKRGDLLWPLRAALTGEKKSPSPFECAWVLGKIESLNRLEKAISKI